MSRKISIGDGEIKFVDNVSNDTMATIYDGVCSYCDKEGPVFKDFAAYTYAGSVCYDCMCKAFDMFNKVNLMNKKANIRNG